MHSGGSVSILTTRIPGQDPIFPYRPVALKKV